MENYGNSFMTHIVLKMGKTNFLTKKCLEWNAVAFLEFQLEVLYSQTIKLISERLGDYIRIEEYKPG
jgi:hypothetical protein